MENSILGASTPSFHTQAERATRRSLMGGWAGFRGSGPWWPGQWHRMMRTRTSLEVTSSREVVRKEVFSREVASKEVFSREVDSREVVSKKVFSSEVVSREVDSREVTSLHQSSTSGGNI